MGQLKSILEWIGIIVLTIGIIWWVIYLGWIVIPMFILGSGIKYGIDKLFDEHFDEKIK